MIKLVIFDLDGVLVDTKMIHFKALNNAIEEVAGKQYVISEADHFATYDGLGTKTKLKMLSISTKLPTFLHDQIAERKQYYTESDIETFINKREPYTHACVDVLTALKNKGICVCVVSNAVRNTVRKCLSSARYAGYIDRFYSSDDVRHQKPHPEGYMKCMVDFGVTPQETLILEDSPRGIEAARSSGAHVMIIENFREGVNLESIKNKIDSIHNSKQIKVQTYSNKNINVLIPMAGAGSRFEQAGYAFPKPLIDVNGKPMIQVVTDSLGIDGHYIFVVHKEHYVKYNLEHLLHMMCPDCDIVQVDKLTEGAACTTLLAKQFINNDNPLIIANSDQYIEWNPANFLYSMFESRADAGILTFKSLHPKWSYVKLDSKGNVMEVAEKKPISDMATVGIYYWKNGRDYVEFAEQMINNNIRVNGEFYVCPVLNEAIAANKKIKTFPVGKMQGLGTPEDLQQFLKGT